MYQNFATLDGQQYVKVDEQLIVELWIMFVHKLLKDKIMMTVLIFGV